MGQQVLNNPQLSPTPELLQTVLGDNYVHFDFLMGMFDRHGILSEWNYYKDGKSWLCKVQYKKNTVLWLSVWEDCFKLSFFFTEKTKSGVDELEIASSIKEDFKQQKVTGKLIPLILEIRDNSLLGDVEKIIEYKMKCK